MSKLSPAFVPHGTYCCGFVAARGIAPDSVAYAQQHREWHVARFPARFPASTPETLANLDKLIASAKSRAQGAA